MTTEPRRQPVYHGRERQPVVVFDDFLGSPEDLVEDAGFLGFSRLGEHYPGVRARVPDAVLAAMVDRVRPEAAEVFGVRDLVLLEAFYSLVTTRPTDLSLIQRLPHFDGVEGERLALLCYLARDERSGTAFYRHRTTGFESVDAARLPLYRRALEHDLARGHPGPGYIAGDTSLYEETGVHRALFNRAILYRSNALHCARLPDDAELSADPAAGRLTVNVFLTGTVDLR